MTVSRVEKGTVVEKTLGTTLTISAMTLTGNQTLMVATAAMDDPQGAPTVAWGGTALDGAFDGGNYGADSGMGLAVWRFKFAGAGTEDLVATWPVAVEARAMVATAYSNIAEEDAQIAAFCRRNNVGPNVDGPPGPPAPPGPGGGTLKVSFSRQLAVVYFVSNGPVEDLPGTLETTEPASTVLVTQSGQRVGTTGGAAATNVTVHEIWEEIADRETDNLRTKKNDPTDRDWVISMMGFRNVNVTPQEADEASIDEYFGDFQDFAALLLANYNVQVTLTDGGAINTTDIASLSITKTQL